MKTADLTGAHLDWAVARALGIPAEELRPPDWSGSLFRYLRNADGELDGRYMTGPDLLFSRKWEAGGPIIEREEIGIKRRMPSMPGERWEASGSISACGAGYRHAVGLTPLIAAMRCFVASKLGPEVDVPF